MIGPNKRIKDDLPWIKPVEIEHWEDLLLDAQFDAIEALEYAIEHGYRSDDDE